jgi:hypothetical protein
METGIKREKVISQALLRRCFINRKLKMKIKISHAIIASVLFLFSLRLLPDQNRVLTIPDLLDIVTNFEKTINKDVPTLADYNQMYPCVDEDPESNWETFYCKKIIKVGAPSKECTDFHFKREKEPEKAPSFFLWQIKNVITDGQKDKIKLFVDPNIKPCTEEAIKSNPSFEDLYRNINVIAQIGDKKIKNIKLVLPCNSGNRDALDQIHSFYIDSKNINEFPVMIKGPVPDPK